MKGYLTADEMVEWYNNVGNVFGIKGVKSHLSLIRNTRFKQTMDVMKERNDKRKLEYRFIIKQHQVGR